MPRSVAPAPSTPISWRRPLDPALVDLVRALARTAAAEDHRRDQDGAAELQQRETSE